MFCRLRGRSLAFAAASIVCVAAFAAEGEAAEAKKRAAKTAPSVCVGLSEGECAGNAICYWRKAATLKSGKTRKAHCRKKPKRMAKQITPA
jgi:hypothetical protein